MAIRVRPGWHEGDTFRYSAGQYKMIYLDDKSVLPIQYDYDALLSVERMTDSGSLMHWQGAFDFAYIFTISPEVASGRGRMDLDVRYKVTPEGRFAGLTDPDSLAREIRTFLTDFAAYLRTVPEGRSDADLVEKNIPYLTMRQAMEKVILQPLVLIHGPAGIDFVPGKPLTARSETVTPLSTHPVVLLDTIVLDSLDRKKGIARIRHTSSADPEQIKKVLHEYLKRMGHTEEEIGATADEYEYRIDTKETYLMDLNRGIPTEVEVNKLQAFGNGESRMRTEERLYLKLRENPLDILK
ncbi:MAG: hypothetical protein GXO27_00870 [Chlorobi bacterium]|nr:hypothetical protein [Chlorobiota bacterium]